MQLGMIGLGKMGSFMAERLMKGGHQIVAFDLNQKSVQDLAQKGATASASMQEMVSKLPKPRIVWMMVPAGEPTEKCILQLRDLLQPGDIVIDGGNSFYQDDIKRAKMLNEKGIWFVDAGTSGGVWGVERGYCLMIGGDEKVVKYCESIFKTLAPGKGNLEPTKGRDRLPPSTAEEGYLHCGPVGAGHFVKMVHNGIEYGIMQAYAEGFSIFKKVSSEHIPQDRRYELNVTDIAEVWRRGSVIGSWLLDLTAMALAQSPELKEFTGFVEDSGEGRWTVNAAVEEAVPAPVLTSALYARFRSRLQDDFADKLLSAMRFQFGGHVEIKKE